MCGIFGASLLPECGLNPGEVRRIVDELFRLSESRGKEAAGLALRTSSQVAVYKQPLSASKMIRQKEFNRFFDELVPRVEAPIAAPLTMVGHTRLTTNGLQYINENNQPVVKNGLVAVHNGIITNEGQIWKDFSELSRDHDVDTEALLGLVDHFRRQGADLTTALKSSYAHIEGTAAVAMLDRGQDALYLATNYGSLYFCQDAEHTVLFFASEKHILDQLARFPLLRNRLREAPTTSLRAHEACRVHSGNLRLVPFGLNGGRKVTDPPPEPVRKALEIVDYSDAERARSGLRRCRRCVTPETVPFTTYDEDGVCNFCHSYEAMTINPLEELESQLQRYRSKDGEPDCIVMLSGGRDSSYGLYYIKEVLNMHPIAYTYDWGMITDLARRNAARVCGKLGVEHIIVSADIARKRRYVRKNIQAWIKRPNLGMIPLFMAGDKQYYYYANRLREQTGIKPIIVCECPLELTKFKAGFCGIEEGNRRLFDISISEKVKLSSYYALQYLGNPAYLNASLLDNFFAFFSSYFMQHDYHFLYRYHRWNEQTVSSTLIDDFGFELAPDTNSTWRIGDGTAPFYNYIYHTVAGFTENDTLRSNQIREGDLSREEAMRLVETENRPRWESIEWYARTIGFDLDEALEAIHSMPKLYG